MDVGVHRECRLPAQAMDAYRALVQCSLSCQSATQTPAHLRGVLLLEACDRTTRPSRCGCPLGMWVACTGNGRRSSQKLVKINVTAVLLGRLPHFSTVEEFIAAGGFRLHHQPLRRWPPIGRVACLPAGTNSRKRNIGEMGEVQRWSWA